MNMIENKIRKLEAPERIRELVPEATLRRIGVGPGQVVCDIGAGSGIFTFPAAQLTQGRVYAVEIDDGMLAWLAQKAETAHGGEVMPVKVEGLHYPIADASIDWALMVTMLHEIPDKLALIRDTRRMLKSQGKAAVIEFHEQATMGPPAALRIPREETLRLFEGEGFTLADAFDMGKNLYCQVFRK